MSRAKLLLVAVLLLSYGAVGARQPAVRGLAPLPVPAEVIAGAVGLPSSDPSTLLLDLTRVLYDGTDLDHPRVRGLRAALRTAMSMPGEKTHDRVPLPLDPSIWRDTLLGSQVPDQSLVAAIVGDRRASLLYHGLSALDDETLAWLGPDRETLTLLRSHPGTFAVFGRSVHVRAGRVLLPGGDAAAPLWEEVVGVSPSKTSAFVQHLFKNDRTAFFYDTIAHLDPAQQRFALGMQLPKSSREDRFYALFETFLEVSPEWRAEVQPFLRPLVDPGIALATIAVTENGAVAGPMSRRLWDRVFRGDDTIDVSFSPIGPREIAIDTDTLPPDAASFASRVSRVAYSTGRRRLDTLLFAQRVFGSASPDDAAVATALRGFVAYPALMLTLERLGITDATVYVAAAQHASALDDIDAEPARRAATTEFQAALGILERISRTGVLRADNTQLLVSALVRVDLSPQRAYEGRLAQWIATTLTPMLPSLTSDASDPIEETIVSAMAGVQPSAARIAPIEWEGARYRVDPAAAERERLRRIRAHQGGVSLDAAMSAIAPGDTDGGSEKVTKEGAVAAEQSLGNTLASILYAAYLGDPNGTGVTAGNAALKHDLGASAAWRLPNEDFSGRSGWKVRGSLLGLDAALGRLGLRRIDPTSMPPEPKMGPQQRVALTVTASLLTPLAMTDAARDEIAAALGRGRARVATLTADDAEIERVAREAGLSEWRRVALAWTVEYNRAAAPAQFSLLELFWLGAPRASAARSIDAWGAAMLPLTGCLCLEMPRPRPWEDMAGRRLSGLMATRAADVALRVADALAALDLPASLAPGIVAFALQEVSEHAQLAYADDWQEFGRAARALPLDRLTDYIAALTANGPLVPIDGGH